jgi:hypothetical protein
MLGSTASTTSLALYASTSFFEQRKVLQNLETDMEQFIEEHVRQGRLRREGWDAETLQALLRLEFSPVHPENDCQYYICSCEEWIDL